MIFASVLVEKKGKWLPTSSSSHYVYCHVSVRRAVERPHMPPRVQAAQREHRPSDAQRLRGLQHVQLAGHAQTLATDAHLQHQDGGRQGSWHVYEVVLWLENGNPVTDEIIKRFLGSFIVLCQVSTGRCVHLQGRSGPGVSQESASTPLWPTCSYWEGRTCTAQRQVRGTYWCYYWKNKLTNRVK